MFLVTRRAAPNNANLLLFDTGGERQVVRVFLVGNQSQRVGLVSNGHDGW